MTDALKPCPFCGAEPDRLEHQFGDESGYIRCRNCGAQSGRVYWTEAERESDDYSASEAEAVVAWNRRAAPAVPALVPHWIPVTEQLPEKYTEVLVAFCGQVSLASTGQYTGNKHDTNGWCYPAENNGGCDDGSDPVVTHWMPLPEVPPHPNFAAGITAKEAPK